MELIRLFPLCIGAVALIYFALARLLRRAQHRNTSLPLSVRDPPSDLYVCEQRYLAYKRSTERVLAYLMPHASRVLREAQRAARRAVRQVPARVSFFLSLVERVRDALR